MTGDPPAPGLPAPTLAGSTVVQSATLEHLASAVNYIDWLAAVTEPHLGDRVLEIGSGTGDYARRWLAADPARRITVTEADPGRLLALRERMADHPRVQVAALALPVPPGAPVPGASPAAYSAVVALNVLEHVEDHVAALASVVPLLAPGGRVVLVVPAFPSAMSRFDREIGHFRRYRRATLTAALVDAGLRPVEVRYLNPMGLLAWLVVMRVLRRGVADGPALRLWDRAVVPLLRRLDRPGLRPWGQSLLAVAERPRQGEV